MKCNFTLVDLRTANCIKNVGLIVVYFFFSFTPLTSLSQDFAPGSLIVARVGDGSTTLSDAAFPVALIEMTTAGSTSGLKTITFTSTGAGTKLTQSGIATSEGEVVLSTDGRYLTVAGYNATSGTASVKSGTNQGTIALIDKTGTVTYPVTINRTSGHPYSGDNFRSAVTTDGTKFWTSGDGASSKGGAYYFTSGSANSDGVQVSTTNTNTRIVQIVNGQLYTTSSSDVIHKVGTGTPTTTGNTMTNYVSANTPYSFVFLDMDATVSGPDVVYIASQGTNGILKYSYNGTTWTARGSLKNTTGNYARGITAAINCSGTVDLYVTTGVSGDRPTKVVKVNDAAAYNANITSNGSNISSVQTLLYTAPAKYALGGICFAPTTNGIVTKSTDNTLASGNFNSLSITAGTTTLSGNIYVADSLYVAGGATLDCGSYTITGSKFRLISGGNIKIGSVYGITASTISSVGGNVQTSCRSFSTGANYTYSGTADQATGDGLPTTVNNFSCSNANYTVTATSDLTINGTISIPSTNTLNMGGNELGAGTSYAMSGTGLLKTLSSDGSHPIPSSKAWDFAVEYGRSGNQSVVAGTYNILLLSGGSTKTMVGDATIVDSLKINSSTTLALSTKSIILRSAATKTARVAQLGTGAAITYGSGGKFFVQRYLPAKRAWRLLSPPVITGTGTSHTISEAWQEGQAFNYNNTTNAAASQASDSIVNSGFATLISGGPGKTTADGFDVGQANTKASILQYDKSVSPNVWKAPSNTNSTLVSSERGWMLFVRGDRKSYGVIDNQFHTPTVTTLRPRGQINTGDIRVPATGTLTGLQVVGNPYACALDFHAAYNTTKAANGGTLPYADKYWIWDPYMGGSNGVGSFVSLSSWSGGAYTRSAPLTGTGTSTIDNQYIPSGAAVIVDFGSTGGYITFHEADKVATNTTVAYRPVSNIRTTLNGLEADGSTFPVDGVLNLFNESNNPEVDGDDVPKLTNVEGENFSTKRNGTLLTVDKNKLPLTTDTIFYNWSKVKVRDYQLAISSDSIDAYWVDMYLEDNYKKTQTRINPLDTFRYNFKIVLADSGTFRANRFDLILKNNPPVFTSVTAVQDNSNININWKIMNERGVMLYWIEKSTDGIHFQPLMSGMPEASTTGDINGIHVYNGLDGHPQIGDNYYQIKAIGHNGKTITSDMIKITVAKPSVILLSDLSTNNTATLKITDLQKGVYGVRIVNSVGQVAAAQTIQHPGGISTPKIQLKNADTKGIYHIEVVKPDGIKVNFKLLKH